MGEFIFILHFGGRFQCGLFIFTPNQDKKVLNATKCLPCFWK